MAYVPIPKDLKKVKTKVAFNRRKDSLSVLRLQDLLEYQSIYLCERSFQMI